MRLSRYILPTLKEDPSDAVVLSHRLMVRAGLIRKESAGMYVYLPLGWRVLRKIIGIVREEMDRAGALEFLMPELTNADLWKESGRWDTMGPEMFRIRDRNAMEYALAPTHEEAFTAAVRGLISSYRDLPVNVYQINTKFRDEIRPRFGVIRSKEFIMKDAYSFDMDEEGLEKSYQAMRTAYRRVFERCGLETIPVEADTGSMGGSNSEEFMVASEVGEESLLLCDTCGYRANREKAEYGRPAASSDAPKDMTEVATPDVKTIDDLAAFFKCPPDRFFKSIIYVADGKPVMAVVLGNREINELKLARAAGAASLELAPDSVVEEVTGAPVGFAGPVTKKNIRIIFDLSVQGVVNGITGANKKDVHFDGVNPGRDFAVKEEADITCAEEGDPCPKCGAAMYVKKGIEVGHIFKLGYKYTKSMNVKVVNEQGTEVTPIMGCYGIGVNRTMAAVVEQHNDDKGIIWPAALAPFDIHLVGLGKGDDEVKKADEIYDLLTDKGFEVLYDDRKASPGVKFADADLVGLPVRITIGKNYFQTGEAEVKLRSGGDVLKVKKDELADKVRELLR
ncbi:MAG TPA: proline--tRNA ligase [Spirochaetota bacterium]|nr:proline--tRNA ligase [Spirochaetota bacterium]HPC43227.1 proline--tRNA ligase [Spirochaetota bacterium]HPL16533.1 proline--tRNA ligase [Spirochaetota bacterium]HQF06692.1 proline--tRNA ligase [Spirochaetota bacterium]HQH95905.1 proline--tRNA ligase [Spirochaetota bacterium]